MDNLKIFEYQGAPIEFETIDGELYANATAMCQAFGKRPHEWMRLPNTERYVNALKSKRENPVSLIISNKGGIVGGGSTWVHEKLILKLAQWLDVHFEIWCDQKIAELLRTGKVELAPETTKPLPRTYKEALQALLTEVEERERVEAELEKATEVLQLQAPKAEYYDRAMQADGNFTVNEVAKMLGTGQNRLFQRLRDDKVLYVRAGHNVPFQEYVDRGWFVVKHKMFHLPSGERSYPQIFVTPKGVEAIRRKVESADGIFALTKVVL